MPEERSARPRNASPSLPPFPPRYVHDHPPVANVNDLVSERLTVGQRASDRVAAVMGSWPFIIGQSVFLAAWAALNVTAWVARWDPYPFILMNLFLSLQAAYAAPVIMMSQNRQALKDRIEAHNDFLVNLKAEREIRVILEHLEAQHRALLTLHATLLGRPGEWGGAGPAEEGHPSVEP